MFKFGKWEPKHKGMSLFAGHLNWSRESDLNRRPDDYKSTALPLSYPGVMPVGGREEYSIKSPRQLDLHRRMHLVLCVTGELPCSIKPMHANIMGQNRATAPPRHGW